MSAIKDMMYLSSFKVMVASLILITFFAEEIVLLISIKPSFSGTPAFSKAARSKGVLLSKTPWTIAFSSPCLIISEAALSPKRRPIQSMIKLLPAPVSPVKTVRPSLKSISISSIIAKFWTFNFINMLIW